VNDVLAQGAEPLFFLDDFATGMLDTGVAETVIAGIAQGCRMAECALIGGETAEMPGMYANGDYDLAGFCVGAVERGTLLPRDAAPGDVLVGLTASGAHANGFSLIRKIIADAGLSVADPAPFEPGRTLGDILLAPTRIYVKPLLPVLKVPEVRGFAHITGGGLTDNIPRVLKSGLRANLDSQALALPPLFAWLKSTGGLNDAEMLRTFNCGIGGVLIIAPDCVEDLLASLREKGESPVVIGDVREA